MQRLKNDRLFDERQERVQERTFSYSYRYTRDVTPHHRGIDDVEFLLVMSASTMIPQTKALQEEDGEEDFS